MIFPRLMIVASLASAMLVMASGCITQTDSSPKVVATSLPSSAVPAQTIMPTPNTPQPSSRPNPSPTPTSGSYPPYPWSTPYPSPTPDHDRLWREATSDLESSCFWNEFGHGNYRYQGAYWYRHIQWTSDGSAIVFDYPSTLRLLPAPSDVRLYAVESDGSRIAQLVNGGPTELSYEYYQSQGIGIVEALYSDLAPGFMMYFDISDDRSQIVYSTCVYQTKDPNYRPTHNTYVQWLADVQKYEHEIAVSNIDGSNPMRLTENRTIDNFPVWSPDGTRIVFIRSRSDSRRGGRDDFSLYAMDADGSDARAIAPNVALYPPAWSPDGQWIAFVAYDEAHGWQRAVYIVRLDGSNLTRIFGAFSSPSWSPDSRYLAFAGPYGDGVALYTFAADGTAPFVVTNIVENLGQVRGALWVPSVSWSPAGHEILYSCGGVCVANIDGRRVFDGRRVGVSPLGFGSIAAWSPDGSRIAVSPGGFRLDERDSLDDNVVLYTINSDGTGLNVLVKSDHSNDGRPIASKPSQP